MPKYLLVNRAQGQATAAPNASATSITLTASGDTAEFTAAGSPSATSPISAILTDVADITAPTLIETVLITDITGDVLTLTRDADGQGAQDFSSGSCYITVVDSAHLLKNMLQRDNDSAQRLRGVPVDVTANISGNALAFDYDADGDYQYATLSASSTVLTVTNVPAGARMLIVLLGADVYAPDISAFTPVLNDATITFDAVTVIEAEALTSSTVRYIDGGRYAS